MAKILESEVREVFVDTNILIDLVIEREPYFMYANYLFLVAEKKSIVLNICSLSYNTVHYYVRKHYGLERAKMGIDLMWNFTKCLSVSHTIIQKAMKSAFRDFKDAIQYYCALQIPKCEAIITRDAKDFKLSVIPVIKPERFLGEEM